MAPGLQVNMTASTNSYDLASFPLPASTPAIALVKTAFKIKLKLIRKRALSSIALTIKNLFSCLSR